MLALLRQGIGEDIPWIGFHSYGEYGPVEDKNYFHNYTAVVAAVY